MKIMFWERFCFFNLIVIKNEKVYSKNKKSEWKCYGISFKDICLAHQKVPENYAQNKEIASFSANLGKITNDTNECFPHQ